MDEVVLNAALAANARRCHRSLLDGNTASFQGGVRLGYRALEYGEEARPKMPVLDADLGKAWLHLKNDPVQALKYFRDGVANDPTNSEIYVGLDEAMTLTGVSAKERAETLGHYPSIATMPASLVYQLALARAEAGEYRRGT